MRPPFFLSTAVDMSFKVPNWNVIKRDKLVPLVDLLPDNQRTAIFQIAPKPLIGRWIPGDQLISK